MKDTVKTFDIMFKIDLIVWKYTFLGSPPKIASAFKIDLIVWKYEVCSLPS